MELNDAATSRDAAAAAAARCRCYLSAVSSRECALPGLPTGALVVEWKHASSTVAAFRTLSSAVAGKKASHTHKVRAPRTVPGTSLLVIPVSSEAADLFCTPSPELDRLLEHAEWYSRVRAAHDSFFGDLPERLPAPWATPASVSSSCEATFTFAELFAGVGGFRLGLEPLGGRCVFSSEIDVHARDTYALNFGTAGTGGDIVDVYARDLPPFDLLTGGFPCQPFSARGEQRGLADPRGQLYREMARLLTVCQPRMFLFENVPALVRGDAPTAKEGAADAAHAAHDAGADAGTTDDAGADDAGATDAGATDAGAEGGALQLMLDAFARAGYDVSWHLVNARGWVPQSRRRVYFVGFRRDLNVRAFAPPAAWRRSARGSSGRVVRDVLEPPTSPAVALASLTAEQWAKIQSPAFVAKSKREPSTREIDLDGDAPTLTSSCRTVTSLSSTFVFEAADGTRRELPRFLTPRECARLMGFPDSFRFGPPGPDGRHHHIYRQMGNAVVPPVIGAFGREMLRALGAARC